MIRFDALKAPGFCSLLDHIRWLSAMVVLCGHARNRMFAAYAQVPDLPLPGKLLYALTNIQNEAVLCFFVLSGLLIGGKLLDYLDRPQFPVGRYIIDRISRLYVVLLPALALSYASTAAGVCETGAATDWLGGAVFVQHVLVSVTPCNPPLWSLANEFWYYTLGLLAALAWRRNRAAAALAVASVILLCFDSWDPHNVLLYLPVWALGTTVFLVRRPPFGPLLPFIAFALAVMASRSHLLDGVFLLRDLLMAVPLAAFLTAAAHAPWARRPIPLARTAKVMAGFSFTLYLTHWPVLHLFIAAARHSGVAFPLDPRQPASYAWLITALALCLGFAALAAHFTEARTAAVRDVLQLRLARWLGQAGFEMGSGQ